MNPGIWGPGSVSEKVRAMTRKGAEAQPQDLQPLQFRQVEETKAPEHWGAQAPG